MRGRFDVFSRTGDGEISDADARSLVVDWPTVVTSPNMSSIPFIPAGNVVMRPMSDGRFGYLDFTLWPQIHSSNFAHRPLVLRRDAKESESISIMWWTPSEADGFVRSDGLFGRLGRLHKGRLGQFEAAKADISSGVDALIAPSPSNHTDLKYYYTSFCLGIARLKHNPYTLCDLILDVAQTQRHYHDVAAYLRYVTEGWAHSLNGVHDEIREPNASLMGCWTRDITVVQRYRRGGVPIFLLRSENEVESNINIERRPSSFIRSPLVVNTDWSYNGTTSPLPTVYSGPPSDTMHAAASQQVKLQGLTNYKLAVDLRLDSRDVVPVGTKNARSKKRAGKGSKYNKNNSDNQCAHVQKTSRDKWKPLDGTFAPPPIISWTTALSNVDRSKSRMSSKPSKEIYGYRFPDPGLIVYAENRLDRYLINWLHIRVAVQHRVYFAVDGDPLQIPVGCSNEQWRSILNSSYGHLDFTDEQHREQRTVIRSTIPSSRRDAASSDSRRELVRAMFGEYPTEESVSQVQWREHVIKSGEVTLLNPMIVQEIVWDLCEHNFRADFLALDRLLAQKLWANDAISRDRLLRSVFPGSGSYICTDTPTDNRGIASLDWRERREFIGNLATVMISWPHAPLDLSGYQERTRSEISFAHFERAVALFFCQNVFDNFGRPAILPCRVRY